MSTRNDLAGVRAELAGLKSGNAELQRSKLDLAGTVKDLTAALASANSSGQPGTPAGAGPAVLASRVEPVPYGEIAFDHSRLEVLREFC